MSIEKPVVLIVDDTPENLQLLVSHLNQEYRVLAANSGKKALQSVRRNPPDLILLDIMMPDMDGYEVCEILKQDPSTTDIPVIFVTALVDDQDEFKGLEIGAVDYISKPFNPDILKSRVKTQIDLQKAKKDLEKHNLHLEELVKQKSKELFEAHERLKTLDAARQDFLAAISHELRTPVNGVLGLADLAYSSLAEHEKDIELQEAFQESSSRLLRTMDDALLLAELQTTDDYVKTEDLDIHHLLSLAADSMESEAQKKNIQMHRSFSNCEVQANHQLVQNAATTLISAGIKLAKPESVLNIHGSAQEDAYHAKVVFSGASLSKETIESFFDIFSEKRSSSYVEELGLSIPVAYRVIQALGGEMEIRNRNEEALEIHFTLQKSHN